MTKIEFIRDLQRSFPHSEGAHRVLIANNIFSMYGEPEISHESDPLTDGPSHLSYFHTPHHSFSISWNYEEGFFIQLQ